MVIPSHDDGRYEHMVFLFFDYYISFNDASLRGFYVKLVLFFARHCLINVAGGIWLTRSQMLATMLQFTREELQWML